MVVCVSVLRELSYCHSTLLAQLALLLPNPIIEDLLDVLHALGA